MVRSALPIPVAAEETLPIQVCPLTVEADATGAPVSVKLSGQWIPVRDVVSRWVIGDEWIPGQTVRRMYWECAMTRRLRITVHQDLDSGRWYW